MAVAWHAQVECLTDVDTELEGMVALNLGPVVDELILVFILNQGAVAPVHAQCIAEAEEVAGVTVDKESGHARIEIIVYVQAGDTGILRRSGANSIRLPKDFITEPAKAEVCQQRRLHCIIKARRNRMIARVRPSGIGISGTRGIEARPTGYETEGARGDHAELLQAVAAEDVQLIGGVVIDAGVEGIVVALHAAGGCEVWRIEVDYAVWRGDQLEQGLRLRGQL